jgi:hypothetical protein
MSGTTPYSVNEQHSRTPPAACPSLQDVCNIGNTTVELTSGTLKTDNIQSSSGSIVDFGSCSYRGLKQTNTLTETGLIDAKWCRGDIVVLSPQDPSVFTLPTPAIAGMHFTLVNNSGKMLRIAAGEENTIDGHPNYIMFPPYNPFVWNVVSPRDNQWATTKERAAISV